MKKRLSLILSFVLAVALSLSALTFASAAAPAFDGTTNLATDATQWKESWWTTNNEYCTIDSNGIVFKEYGTSSAVAAVSLTQLLPMNHTTQIKFKSENATGNGFLKVIFADASGAANGNAMKPWEIADGAEHLALEIKNTTQLWQYNPTGAFVSAHQGDTLPLANGNATYIDGNEHTLTIKSSVTATGLVLKITIDDTVQYDGTVTSKRLNCNSVLTIGGYANSTVTDKLTISSVTVKKDAEDVVLNKDMSNLLYTAENWALAEGMGDEVKYNSEEGTLTFSNFGTGNHGVTYKNELPAAYELTAKFDMKVPTPAPEGDQKKGLRFVVLDNSGVVNGTSANAANKINNYFVQVDSDSNVWFMKTVDGEESAAAAGGIWAPGLTGITVTVEPVWESGEGYIEIYVKAGNQTLYATVEDLSYVNGNHLTIGGYNPETSITTFDIKSVKIRDLNNAEAGNIATSLDNWNGVVQATADENGLVVPAQNYVTSKEAFDVESKHSFTMTLTDASEDASLFGTWIRVVVSNYANTSCWYNDHTETTAAIAFTFGVNFYTIDVYNGSAKTTLTTKTANTTNHANGKATKFDIEIVKGENGRTLNVYREGVLDATADLSATNFNTAESLYFSARSTGTPGELVFNKVEFVSKTAIAAKAIMGEIFTLPAVVTEANVADVETQVAAVKEKVAGLDAKVAALVTNADFVTYVEEQVAAVKAVMADKAAAASVQEKVNAVVVPETLDDAAVETLQAAIDAAKTAYEALTDAQKAYVTGYDAVAAAQTKVDEYNTVKADKAAAASVQEKVNAVVVPETLDAAAVETLQAAIDAAKTAYEALTDAQKAYVTGYDAVAAAQTKVDEYNTVKADKAAAKAVEDKIAAIEVPETITKENVDALKTAVNEAKTAYEALTEAQKAYVTNYNVITETEAAITAAENAGQESVAAAGGCGGSVAGMGALVSLIAIAGVALLRKKED